MNKTTSIIILVILVALGIYVGYTFAIKSNVPQTGQQVTENQTADWKTYMNSQYGFEFTYPKDWKISEHKIQNGLSIKLFPDPNSNKGSLTISIETKPYTFCSDCQTLEDVISKNVKILEGSVQNLSPHEGMIDGNKTMEILYRTSYGYQASSIFFINNSKLYTISYLEADDIANKYEGKYRGIVKSIKLKP